MFRAVGAGKSYVVLGGAAQVARLSTSLRSGWDRVVLAKQSEDNLELLENDRLGRAGLDDESVCTPRPAPTLLRTAVGIGAAATSAVVSAVVAEDLDEQNESERLAPTLLRTAVGIGAAWDSRLT